MNKAVALSKWAVALTTALVAGTASAYSFTGGSITLNGSQDAAALAGLANWVITVPTGSTSTAGLTPASDPNALDTFWMTQPLTGASFAADGSVTDVFASGSGVTIARGSNFSTFANLEVDFAHGQILADITTQAGSQGRQKLFDVSGLGNVTTVHPDGSIAVDLAAATVSAAPDQAYKPWWIGLVPVGVGTPTSPLVFGSLAGNVTAAVPEPSTYALIGLGLATVGLIARRRRPV